MDQWLTARHDEMVAETVKLLKIDSVKAAPKENAPFGEGNARCLDTVLGLCESMGFKTRNNQGYYGYAELGEGRPLLGILVHLDVVPAGEGWTYPPFSATISDGKIYARGAVDDKAPAIAAIYAAKAAHMQGFKGRVRIIFGCDEESGWGCMNRYVKEEEIPDFSFSPDAEFPVINTEKCIMHFNISKTLSQGASVTLTGGQRPNVVPDLAVAVPHSAEAASLLRAKEGEEVLFRGTGAHASLVETGENALFAPIAQLSALEGETGEIFRLLKEKLVGKMRGQGMELDIADEASGQLTVNLGVLSLNQDQFSCTLDLRIPITVKAETVIRAIQKHFDGYTVEVTAHQAGHHVPADSHLVKTLLEVYTDLTGLEGHALAIGGGTYARAVPNAVAFGPNLPGQPELAHQKDECIAIEDILLNARIYAHSIIKLLT